MHCHSISCQRLNSLFCYKFHMGANNWTSPLAILALLLSFQTLGIMGNPLQPDILDMVKEVNGTAKLLTFLLDNLNAPPRPPDREWLQLSSRQSRSSGQCSLSLSLALILIFSSPIVLSISINNTDLFVLSYFSLHIGSLSLPLSLSLFLLVGVTVMSYNVLCDKYATRQMYGYCPTWALSWEYRRNILLKEIIDSSADIIALQVCFCTFIAMQIDVHVGG